MGYSDTSERSRLWPGVKQGETPGCLRGHPERLALSTQPRPQPAVGRGRRPSSGSHLAGAAMQPERDQVDSLHDSTAVLSLQQSQLTRGTSSQGTGAPASRRASRRLRKSRGGGRPPGGGGGGGGAALQNTSRSQLSTLLLESQDASKTTATRHPWGLTLNVISIEILARQTWRA